MRKGKTELNEGTRSSVLFISPFDFSLFLLESLSEERAMNTGFLNAERVQDIKNDYKIQASLNFPSLLHYTWLKRLTELIKGIKSINLTI